MRFSVVSYRWWRFYRVQWDKAICKSWPVSESNNESAGIFGKQVIVLGENYRCMVANILP